MIIVRFQKAQRLLFWKTKGNFVFLLYAGVAQGQRKVLIKQRLMVRIHPPVPFKTDTAIQFLLANCNAGSTPSEKRYGYQRTLSCLWDGSSKGESNGLKIHGGSFDSNPSHQNMLGLA